jgi:hypothetical protein
MKKLGILFISSVLIFLMGCKNDQKLMEETIQLVINYNQSVDTNHKLKICTKNTSENYACDSKDAILIENLTLRYPGRVSGNFIFEVTGGSNHVGEFIGLGSADWLNVLNWASGLETVQNEQDLRKFFNLNFMTYGFLQDDPTSIDPGHYLDKNGNIFSESVQSIKDIESIGANLESLQTDRFEEILYTNFGLSTERAEVVAKNIFAYQKLSSRRSLTEKERNFFSTELLGVSFKDAQNALTSGKSENLNKLLESAALKNGTSPEQISSILNEIFL